MQDLIWELDIQSVDSSMVNQHFLKVLCTLYTFSIIQIMLRNIAGEPYWNLLGPICINTQASLFQNLLWCAKQSI